MKVIVKIEGVIHQNDILIVTWYAPNITLKIYKRKAVLQGEVWIYNFSGII